MHSQTVDTQINLSIMILTNKYIFFIPLEEKSRVGNENRRHSFNLNNVVFFHENYFKHEEVQIVILYIALCIE